MFNVDGEVTFVVFDVDGGGADGGGGGSDEICGGR